MSLQKYRTKSEKSKQPNLLPVINQKPIKSQQTRKQWMFTAEIYEKYMRAKLQNVLIEAKKQPAKVQQNKNEKIDIIFKKQVQKAIQPPHQLQFPIKEAIKESRHAKSTPKLSQISPEKQKSVRENRDRYLHNQKISIQLNLPKTHDVSMDSDQDQLHKELLRQQEHRNAEPAVFVLKKNSEYNLIKKAAKEETAYMTQNPTSNSRLQIINNSQSYPMMPNIPQKQNSLYISPKQSKYIKEKFVGEEAINKFYNRYKKIEKIRQLQRFNFQINPITLILTILESYNLPPKKMEIIKLKGQQAILDLKNCALGSGVSIKAVSEIVQKIDLSYNQLTPDICDLIIPNLYKMRSINLSYNKIGRRGIDLLSNLFFNQEIQDDCQLEQLNVQSNNLSDTSFGTFFSNLLSMNFLLVLNLSKNYLGNYASVRLKQYLVNDNQLCELYLHWCEMSTKATKLIFQGLSKNNTLKVLDLSWNQIGLDGIKPFCSMVKANSSLVHLDISFCEIDEADTRVIAKALKSNRSIYGLHYQGNMGFIDFQGFLNSITRQQKETPISIRAGLIQRIHSVSIIKSMHHQSSTTLFKNVCWICEGWEEKYFKIAKAQADKYCFIHLDFQHYNGVRMHDKGSYFQILRMCPLAKIQVFYTKISEQNIITHTHSPTEVGEVKLLPYNRQIPQFTIEHKKIGPISMKYLNFIKQPIYYNQIFNQDYLTKVHCQPRSQELRSQNLFPAEKPRSKKQKKHKKKQQPPELTKEISVKQIPDQFDSIFNKNKGIGDGQSYENFIKKCVDFDVTHSKVAKILKTQKQLKEIKQLLQKNYETFQKIFYYLANNNPNNGGVFSISQLRFEKFIEDQGYETKRVTKAKIRLKVISCLSNVSKDGQIQGFYRPQFFQFLLRLAIQKWCITIPKKEGQTEEQKLKREKYPLPISEAFQKILKSLKKYQQKAESSRWRDQNLASYQISIVIKSYSAFFQQIYEKYAGMTQKNMNTKQKKKLLLQEFKTLFLNAEIRKTKQALKDLQVAYRTAKKLEIEDGISDTGLDYVQFLQTICRFSQGLYLTPIGSQANSLWQKQLIKNQEIPLFLKIQKLLKEIYLKNYDLKNKKFDLLFQTGLFPEQIGILMQYYKEKYQNKQNLRKTFLSTTHIKMNSLQLGRYKKITLKYLLDLLEIKAAEIRQKNRSKMLQIQQQRHQQSEDEEIEVKQ